MNSTQNGYPQGSDNAGIETAICGKCGALLKKGSLTCFQCGAYLGTIGMPANKAAGQSVASMRQGRVHGSGSGSMPRNASFDGGGEGEDKTNDTSERPSPFSSARDASRPGMYTKSFMRTVNPDGSFTAGENYKYYDEPPTPVKSLRQRNFNWLLLILILICVGILGFAGYTIYMSKSEKGMSSKAREITLSVLNYRPVAAAVPTAGVDSNPENTAVENELSPADKVFALATSNNYLDTEAKEDLLEKWNEVEPRIYWKVAEEYLDTGDVEASIVCFRIAAMLDPENYDGLMNLAEAYELNNQDEKAEEIYLKLIQLQPATSKAYSALISLYQENDRRPEASAVMQEAYNKTKDINFYLERKDFIPSSPIVNLSAGRYEMRWQTEPDGSVINVLKDVTISSGDEEKDKKNPEHFREIVLSSPQGYDIYYTLDEKAVLPDEGIRYEQPLSLEEGSFSIRAVCVSDTLTSDELSVSYIFYYPTPPAPKCSLAPNTYNKNIPVTLRPGDINDETMTLSEKAEAQSHFIYYYTIDGSLPDTNSPLYDGTPIHLANGRVTLQAICVNQYGKASSVLTVGYKFTVKPYLPEMYSEADLFTGFELYKTLQLDFTENFGKPKETLATKYLNMQNEAQHLVYDWGYAVFILNGTKWVPVRVEITSGFTQMPRGIGLGASEEEVCAAYKDFGQPDSKDGTRGLYYSYPSVGKIIIRQDGTRVIQYQCETKSSHIWILQYWLNERGRVNKICHYIQP